MTHPPSQLNRLHLLQFYAPSAAPTKEENELLRAFPALREEHATLLCHSEDAICAAPTDTCHGHATLCVLDPEDPERFLVYVAHSGFGQLVFRSQKNMNEEKLAAGIVEFLHVMHNHS